MLSAIFEVSCLIILYLSRDTTTKNASLENFREGLDNQNPSTENEASSTNFVQMNSENEPVTDSDEAQYNETTPFISFVVGNREDGDRVVFGYHSSKDMGYFSIGSQRPYLDDWEMDPEPEVKVEEVVYPKHPGVRITCIKFDEFYSSGNPEVVSGGLGHDHVRIVTRRNASQEYRFTAKIYGMVSYVEYTTEFHRWEI